MGGLDRTELSWCNGMSSSRSDYATFPAPFPHRLGDGGAGLAGWLSFAFRKGDVVVCWEDAVMLWWVITIGHSLLAGDGHPRDGKVKMVILVLYCTTC
jgi:hypothetical protein